MYTIFKYVVKLIYVEKLQFLTIWNRRSKKKTKLGLWPYLALRGQLSRWSWAILKKLFRKITSPTIWAMGELWKATSFPALHLFVLLWEHKKGASPWTVLQEKVFDKNSSQQLRKLLVKLCQTRPIWAVSDALASLSVCLLHARQRTPENMPISSGLIRLQKDGTVNLWFW